ncbi:hypothetical protein [Microbispora oryzae]|nr:hypothetical protein [Microbispora oryzae]
MSWRRFRAVGPAELAAPRHLVDDDVSVTEATRTPRNRPLQRL